MPRFRRGLPVAGEHPVGAVEAVAHFEDRDRDQAPGSSGSGEQAPPRRRRRQVEQRELVGRHRCCAASATTPPRWAHDVQVEEQVVLLSRVRDRFPPPSSASGAILADLGGLRCLLAQITSRSSRLPSLGNAPCGSLWYQ